MPLDPTSGAQSRGAAYTRPSITSGRGPAWGDIKAAGFGLKEIVLVDTPKTFPPSGFQLGAVHLSRGWTGPVTLTDWNELVASVDGGAPGGLVAEKRSTVRPSPVRPAQPAPCSTLAELHAINRRLDTLLAK